MAESNRAITKLAQTAQRSQTRLKRIQEEQEKTLQRSVNGLEIIAGGVLGGLADGTLSDEEELTVFDIPVVPVVGGASMVSTLVNYPGATHVGSIGAGMFAYWAGRFVKEQF